MKNKWVNNNTIEEDLGDRAAMQPPWFVNEIIQVYYRSLIGNAKMVQHQPAPSFRNQYMEYYHSALSLYEYIVLPPLPPGQTIVVTISLI